MPLELDPLQLSRDLNLLLPDSFLLLMIIDTLKLILLKLLSWSNQLSKPSNWACKPTQLKLIWSDSLTITGLYLESNPFNVWIIMSDLEMGNPTSFNLSARFFILARYFAHLHLSFAGVVKLWFQVNDSWSDVCTCKALSFIPKFLGGFAM